MSSSQDSFPGYSDSREPEQELYSPFLDEELFADEEAEADQAWENRLMALQSPFFEAFEERYEGIFEPEVEESEEFLAELDEEEFDQEEELEIEESEEFFDELDEDEFDDEQFADYITDEEEELESEEFDELDEEEFYEEEEEIFADFASEEPESKMWDDLLDELDDNTFDKEFNQEVDITVDLGGKEAEALGTEQVDDSEQEIEESDKFLTESWLEEDEFEDDEDGSFEDETNWEKNIYAEEDEALMGEEELEEQFFSTLKSLYDRWRRNSSSTTYTITNLTAKAKPLSLAQAKKRGKRAPTISSRKPSRNLSEVDAVVLHQMAFNRDNNMDDYLHTVSHYIIMQDGSIGKLYDHDVVLNASNCFNSRSIAIEFAGNFPSTRGKYYKPYEYGRHQLTKAQAEAGRHLLRTLTNDASLPNLKYVFAHRQSSRSRGNDPGPDIWYNVGEWAIQKLGLSDGGPSFKCGKGKSINPEWKSWGKGPLAGSVTPTGISSPSVPTTTTSTSVLSASYLIKILGRFKALLFLSYINNGNVSTALSLAYKSSIMDENKLTNLIFYARRSNQPFRKLKKGDPLAKDWLRIRNQEVRPWLRGRNNGSKDRITDTTVKVDHSKYKNWRGVKVRKTVPFRLMGDHRDIILGATAAAEGGYDTVNMYDRGILSWGILQWTFHAGSLQNALAYIKQRLAEIGQISLWSKLFPDLDIRKRRRKNQLFYQGKPVIGQKQLRLLFRGTTSPGKYNKEKAERWARIFALAGRNPTIQKLQRKYARKRVDDVFNQHLGETLVNWKQNTCRKNKKLKGSWKWICPLLTKYPEFYRSNYSRIREYVKHSLKAATLLFGMWTNNRASSFIHFKKAIDNLANRYRTYNIAIWPSGWQNELTTEFERVLRASNFGYWGDAKAKSARPRRKSRTQKILNAFNKLNVNR